MPFCLLLRLYIIRLLHCKPNWTKQPIENQSTPLQKKWTKQQNHHSQYQGNNDPSNYQEVTQDVLWDSLHPTRDTYIIADNTGDNQQMQSKTPGPNLDSHPTKLLLLLSQVVAVAKWFPDHDPPNYDVGRVVMAENEALLEEHLEVFREADGGEPRERIGE
ncbi:hypothetical protein BDK51DRAFT_34144 [Blyttiomyces helicus]|uniref:Uncharacterized protein n=1 Tax=Blyttiomyces helicus TaxID=388810 RepID=A0A4P9WNB0_9FUNG|nr:hypothetical protein BDK51DRAFT_34144 [Blyttiomyces helicus]|eukprot:RKO92246.1 hypothetical protein BDK51DRAFT_34144 [Blyttiomyces helicus]